MNHKGIEYSLTRSETPDIWKWQFGIGNLVKSGTTQAKASLAGRPSRPVEDRP
jgi:hypothetical protein